jgi:uncharacterized protein YdcH (DUF465 family)
MIMDEQKEAEVRMMLKREGKSHEEINQAIKAWRISEEKEALDAEIQQAIDNPEPEIEEEEPEPKKVSVLQIDESLIVSAIKEGLSKSDDAVSSKKLEILGRIEEQVSAKLDQLNREIASVETEKAELKKLYEKAQVEFVNDRLKARENYSRGLESFFGKIFEVLTNFSDSQVESSLVLLFVRNGTVISLAGTVSSKKTLSKDEIKLGAD